jgi:hypothetical protein
MGWMPESRLARTQLMPVRRTATIKRIKAHRLEVRCDEDSGG